MTAAGAAPPAPATPRQPAPPAPPAPPTPPTPPTPPAPRPLRRDAAANAERVLAAAVRAGLAEGRQVPMAQVAAEAGVGVGTLYRRYPTREALLDALQARAYGLLLNVTARAAAECATGLAAVERFLAGSYAVRDQLVLPLHGAPSAASAVTVGLRTRLHAELAAVVASGHRDGTVRRDVSAATVIRFGAAMAQPLGGPMGSDDVAAEQRAVFLRGISAPDR